MADDRAAILRHLGVSDADVFGWSDGGHVALAIRHTGLRAPCRDLRHQRGLTKETLDCLTKGAAASAEAAASKHAIPLTNVWMSALTDTLNVTVTELGVSHEARRRAVQDNIEQALSCAAAVRLCCKNFLE